MAGQTNLRAWEGVIRQIEQKLVSGELCPGDRLAPERTLAARLGVGRSSVREAIRVLEVFGLVRTRVGSGPESGAIIVARPTEGMSTLMRLQVAGGGFAVSDVVTTRLVLEAAVVTALATPPSSGDTGWGDTGWGARTRSGTGSRVSPGTGTITGTGDLSAAIALLDAMDDGESRAAADFLVLDAAFHTALATAAGNGVITVMMAALRDPVEGYALAEAAFLPCWTTTSERLRAEHRGVVAAVLSHDPELARTRIRDHITGYLTEINNARLAHAADEHAANEHPGGEHPDHGITDGRSARTKIPGIRIIDTHQTASY